MHVQALRSQHHDATAHICVHEDAFCEQNQCVSIANNMSCPKCYWPRQEFGYTIISRCGLCGNPRPTAEEAAELDRVRETLQRWGISSDYSLHTITPGHGTNSRQVHRGDSPAGAGANMSLGSSAGFCSCPKRGVRSSRYAVIRSAQHSSSYCN